jgi:hypothetical protein
MKFPVVRERGTEKARKGERWREGKRGKKKRETGG